MTGGKEPIAAFVLHTRPYRETSVLVDLFTLDYGRVSLVARGARRAGSSLRATLQPFTLLAVQFRGRDELKTLLNAEPTERLPLLGGRALLCGIYANELLERLLKPAEPLPRLFLYYRYLLNELSAGDDIEGALRTFERQLLHQLGVWPDCSHLSDPYYHYVESLQPCRPESRGAIAVNMLREIEADRYTDPQVRRVAKYLMREMLKRLLGDKPLRSRALFEKRTPAQGAKGVKSDQSEPYPSRR